MAIYIINLFSIFMWHILLVVMKVKTRIKSIIFISIMTIQLFIIAAFRDFNVGFDTYNYVNRFFIIAHSDWRYLNKLPDRLDFELGYIYLNKLVSIFSDNPRFFLVIVNIFILVSFASFIYKYSKIPWLSYFIFISMGYWGSSINVLRQVIAIAIILPAINFVSQNKFWRFLFLVLLASTIHTSALVFLLVYPLSKIKLNKFYYMGMVIGLTFIYLIADVIIQITITTFGYQNLINRLDTGSGTGMLILLLLIATGAIIYKSQANSHTNNFDLYFKIFSLGVFLNVLSLNFAMFGRAMLYFTIINIILIPNLISSMERKLDRTVSVSIVLIGLTWFYIFKSLTIDAGGIVPYLFAR